MNAVASSAPECNKFVQNEYAICLNKFAAGALLADDLLASLILCCKVILA